MTRSAVLCLVIVVVHGYVWSSAEGLRVKPPHYLNQWAANIPGGSDNAHAVAKRNGFEIVSTLNGFDDYYLLKRYDVPHRSRRSAHHHTRRLIQDGQIPWAEQQVSRSRVKREVEFHVRRDGGADFNDPLYKNEWYIEDQNEPSRTERDQNVHLNLRVREAWEMGYTGKGVVVSVLDDGIERTNPEIRDNYDPYASTDLNDDDRDPMPRYDPTNENKHGTRCAGEIAMVANNGQCGVGIAFNSKIGGVRMLDGKVTDSLEALALAFNHSHIDIYSSSWGPNDDGVTLEGPGHMASMALEKGIIEGRKGKGVIYAWASGNGGRMEDNCNCDGYTSSIYTLSVSSASQHGHLPWYGERCSSTLAATYSSGNSGDHQVVSADLHNKCTTRHTGTSASAPMAAGIFALVLEANPEVTWRDMQHLVALTSKVGPLASDDGWYQNGAGFCVNLGFGFGLLDAAGLVSEAKEWTPVPPKSVCEVSADSLSNLPQKLTSGHSVEVMINTNGCAGQHNEVNYLEHVQFVLTLSYTKRGAVSVVVTSPSGTQTTLMRGRQWDQADSGFQEWPLMSVHSWGEDPKGVWKFEVLDKDSAGSHHGMLKDVKMVLHGSMEAPHYLQQGKHRCDVPLNAQSGSTTPGVSPSSGRPEGQAATEESMVPTETSTPPRRPEPGNANNEGAVGGGGGWNDGSSSSSSSSSSSLLENMLKTFLLDQQKQEGDREALEERNEAVHEVPYGYYYV